MNRGSIYFITLLVCLTGLTGCKSEFERIRASNDPEVIYEKANEYYEEGDYLKASTLMELVLSNYRGRAKGEELFYRYADSQYKMELYITAAYYFERFASTYANSDKREDAEFMVAESYYALSPTFRLEQQYTEKAIDAYQHFVNRYQVSSRVQICNERIDQLRRKLEKKAFDSAELYYHMANYKAALHSFESLLKDYPETPDAEKIRYLIVKAGFDLAVNSVYEKQQERFANVQKYYETFMRRYPESEYRRELEIIYQKSTQELNKLKHV